MAGEGDGGGAAAVGSSLRKASVAAAAAAQSAPLPPASGSPLESSLSGRKTEPYALGRCAPSTPAAHPLRNDHDRDDYRPGDTAGTAGSGSAAGGDGGGPGGERLGSLHMKKDDFRGTRDAATCLLLLLGLACHFLITRLIPEALRADLRSGVKLEGTPMQASYLVLAGSVGALVTSVCIGVHVAVDWMRVKRARADARRFRRAAAAAPTQIDALEDEGSEPPEVAAAAAAAASGPLKATVTAGLATLLFASVVVCMVGRAMLMHYVVELSAAVYAVYRPDLTPMDAYKCESTGEIVSLPLLTVAILLVVLHNVRQGQRSLADAADDTAAAAAAAAEAMLTAAEPTTPAAPPQPHVAAAAAAAAAAARAEGGEEGGGAVVAHEVPEQGGEEGDEWNPGVATRRVALWDLLVMGAVNVGCFVYCLLVDLIPVAMKASAGTDLPQELAAEYQSATFSHKTENAVVATGSALVAAAALSLAVLSAVLVSSSLTMAYKNLTVILLLAYFVGNVLALSGKGLLMGDRNGNELLGNHESRVKNAWYVERAGMLVAPCVLYSAAMLLVYFEILHVRTTLPDSYDDAVKERRRAEKRSRLGVEFDTGANVTS